MLFYVYEHFCCTSIKSNPDHGDYKGDCIQQEAGYQLPAAGASTRSTTEGSVLSPLELATRRLKLKTLNYFGFLSHFARA